MGREKKIYEDSRLKILIFQKDKPEPKICEWCGKKLDGFVRFSYNDINGEYPFCSKLCMNEWEKMHFLNRIANALEKNEGR